MSEEESTQEIDIEALRERARSSVSDLEDSMESSIESSSASPSPFERETARGQPRGNEDRTVMASSPTNPRLGRRPQSEQSISIEIDMGLAPEDSSVIDGDDDVEDVSDDDDVALVTNDSRQNVDAEYLDRVRHPERYGLENGYDPAPYSQATQYDRAPSQPDDPYGDSDLHAPLARFDDPNDIEYRQPDEREAHSLIGTMPGHDVAQALRAMMGDVPDTPLPDEEEAPVSKPTWEPRKISPTSSSLDEGVTMTRLPEPDQIEALLNSTSEDDALPAFSLDETYEEPEEAPRSEHLRDGVDEALPETRGPSHRGPLPSINSMTVTHTSTSAGQLLSQLPSTRPVGSPREHENTSITRAASGPDPHPFVNEPHDDVERHLEETRATDRGMIQDFPEPDELPHPSIRPPMDTMSSDGPPDDELPRFSLASFADLSSHEPAPLTALSPPPEPGTAPARTVYDPPQFAPEDFRADPEPPPPIEPEPEPEREPLGEDELTAGAMAAVDIDPHSFVDATPAAPAGLVAALIEEAEAEEAEIIEELAPEEIVEEDLGMTSADQPAVVEPPPPDRSTYRPPEQRSVPPPPPDPDAEEKELINEQKWSLLVAYYRQKLANTDGPNKKAAILLKIANVYEKHQEDLNEAFNTLVDALEIAPENEEVVNQLDRVAEAAQRLGELADKVRKRLVPGASDEKRVAYLAHVVYWYEKKLSKGNEVSSLISDIERHDKVHPLVLKRAAQIAAMNGDVKVQREHLARAMERTVRVAEKAALHLQLASAWATTPEAIKHYEAALTLEPTSIVALQGVKRLGKEKELYPQVKWALERQAEVAQTEAERIDAMLELAELEETKFLKRELAAQLLEQVLTLEPSHPQALKGLERCYHALRDWPALARVLAARAEHAFEKKAKVELFELAAEVHESKLGDPAGAIEVYRNLLVVEPKHRRALTDLGRLYEKIGDWENVATYKSRLAELAPTKRASSQELVKLGDFLNTSDRDPLTAKLTYEKAVAIDPTNAAGWEAIQRMAADAGDITRVIECLEQRKKHTEIPRQRAGVLVELARVQMEQGDEDAARKSYEAAIRADSSNEAAAVFMLDAYTADERWSEAAPLCELLVNAAVRDRDQDALFIRLRLQTRIAAALGDADRALTASMAALDTQPMDPGAQADLLAVASQCSGSPSLTRAKDHLLRVAETPDDLTNEQLIKLAVLQRELKDLDSAAACFEAARRREPENHGLTKQLSEIYLEQGDFPRACKLKVDIARNAPNGDLRFELFCEAGEIWAKRADELEKAASVFEEARQIKPLDRKLLDTLKWLYTELGEWELVAGVLEDHIQLEEKPEKKLEIVMQIAEIVRDKLGDSVRAVDSLDRALDMDRKRLDIFEGIVRTLTEEKDWERLERAYRKMIARVKDDDDAQLMFLLFHQLGLIYRDRIGDATRAFDALDAASQLEPANAEVRKIVIELLIVTDQLDNAVARVREEIDRDPHQPELYAELYELFLRQHYFDKAWCCVNVLARLQLPNADQRRFHEDYAPMPLDRVPGQIVEQAWRSHILHSELDIALTNILAILTPAVARMRFGQLRPEQRVGRPFTPNHSRMHQQIRDAFDNSSEILAVNSPELLVADLNSIHPFAPALAPFGGVLVCGPAIEAQSVSLLFLVGKKLAEQRPELAGRAFFPAEKELATLLASSMRVARNEGTKEPTGSALDAALAAALSPQETAQLRNAMMQALADNTAFDVKRWLQLADLSSMRAGLLIAGDIEPARQAIGCEVTAPSDLAPREKLGELLKFAVSDLYTDLRGAIGVAVQS
ncbi:MAG: hypothetical protein U0270_44230 [Labilithrix sp.]